MTKIRVMVVEDERIVALNLQQRLIKLGYDVSAVVTSGAQALEEIERDPPDIILMDVNIDGEIDGIETASRIPEKYYIPVIYLTAYSEEATLQRARTTKPYGFLLKPISERELHATIQMVVERRSADTIVREDAMRHQALVQQRTLELREQIAEREKAEEALRQLQKMEALGHLTGGIAHDFNNLLQGISGSLTLHQKNLKLGRCENADRFLRSAVALVERATGLTHRLLAFARCQPLSPTVVDVNQLIETVEDLARRALGEATTINLRPTAAACLIRCDVNKLESSILNLVINARDAMPDGGRLTIESKNASVDPAEAALLDVVPGQYVCIEVSDTGTGMTADVVARSFEPFFTTKPPGQGTGLGLSMVYGFARQSGGFTKIDSVVGRGTTVKLYLPRFEGSRPVDRSEGIAKGTRAARDGEVILVVEDNEVVRYLVTEALHELGYIVLEAVDGVAGLERLQSTQRVDLLITDVGLPGLGGRQVADGGRKCRPGLKVLFITGYAKNAAMAAGFLAPGMELLTKPFALDALTARIGMMMEDPPKFSSFTLEVT